MKVTVDHAGQQPPNGGPGGHATTDNSEAKTETPAVAAADPNKPVVNGNLLSLNTKDGKQVVIRKMGPLDRMRMLSIIGAENSKNEVYLSMAMPAFCTASINGENIPRPQTVLALEALAERLGDATLLQITLAIGEYFPDAAMNEIVTEFQQRQAIKNL